MFTQLLIKNLEKKGQRTIGEELDWTQLSHSVGMGKGRVDGLCICMYICMVYTCVCVGRKIVHVYVYMHGVYIYLHGIYIYIYYACAWVDGLYMYTYICIVYMHVRG